MTTQPTATRPRPGIDDELSARLLQQRIVLLGTELDETAGNRLVSALLLLSADDPRRDISLWINSPGGLIPSMLAIHDVMRLITNDVSTLALGMACSAGQFLLSAGTPGKRFALPHARILMHQGSAGIGGTAVDVELQADDLRHTRDTVLALIAAHTGQDVETIRHDSLRDRWYTAEQARAYGFVDHVVSNLGEVLPRPHRPIGLGRPGDGADDEGARS